MQKGQARVNARRHTEGGRDECRKVKCVETCGGTRRRAEGGRDKSRKVKRAETRGRW